MKTTATIIAAAAIALTPLSAQAGGWGGKSRGGLINVSPSVDVGDVKLLNRSRVLSGNGILNGNKTGILNGVAGNGILGGSLNNIGVGILKRGGKRRR